MYPADKNLKKKTDAGYLPIVRIIREEDKNEVISYYSGETIRVEENEQLIASVSRSEIEEKAHFLFEAISLSGSTSTFEVPEVEEFVSKLAVGKLKAPSVDKSDIVMQIHDSSTGFEPICGWSIKSELGGNSTLLNAGRTTNFIYEVLDLAEEDVREINEIEGRGKIKQRVHAILDRGSLVFRRTENPVFERNQKLIDSQFPSIMAEALKAYYAGAARSSQEIVEVLGAEDPLDLGSALYEFKFKKFLSSVALGMVPGREWDGRDAATGGYIVVAHSGEVLAFHVYNRNQFEDYLYENTYFDTASTSRHGFGSIYEVDGRKYFNLNLQIRFNKKSK